MKSLKTLMYTTASGILCFGCKSFTLQTLPTEVKTVQSDA